jgi:hypothetical protein
VGVRAALIDWQPLLVVVPDAPSAQRFVPAMRITLAAGSVYFYPLTHAPCQAFRFPAMDLQILLPP